MEDEPLSGSLQSLRGEYEGIREIYLTRRIEKCPKPRSR
jgi:hypothetical protein